MSSASSQVEEPHETYAPKETMMSASKIGFHLVEEGERPQIYLSHTSDLLSLYAKLVAEYEEEVSVHNKLREKKEKLLGDIANIKNNTAELENKQLKKKKKDMKSLADKATTLAEFKTALRDDSE